MHKKIMEDDVQYSTEGYEESKIIPVAMTLTHSRDQRELAKNKTLRTKVGLLPSLGEKEAKNSQDFFHNEIQLSTQRIIPSLDQNTSVEYPPFISMLLITEEAATIDYYQVQDVQDEEEIREMIPETEIEVGEEPKDVNEESKNTGKKPNQPKLPRRKESSKTLHLLL